MSAEDRAKWEQRYREGAYVSRAEPSVWLRQQALQPRAGARALDVACGLGRNARYLASIGYQVDAVDISQEALQRAQRLEAEHAPPIRWLQQDLDQGLPSALGNNYDLIIMMRYLHLSLLAPLAGRLRTGGLLICEVHLQVDPVLEVGGPRHAEFRAQAGTLRAAAEAADLHVLYYHEGLLTDPDGTRVALAQLQASTV